MFQHKECCRTNNQRQQFNSMQFATDKKKHKYSIENQQWHKDTSMITKLQLHRFGWCAGCTRVFNIQHITTMIIDLSKWMGNDYYSTIKRNPITILFWCVCVRVCFFVFHFQFEPAKRFLFKQMVLFESERYLTVNKRTNWYFFHSFDGSWNQWTWNTLHSFTVCIITGNKMK